MLIPVVPMSQDGSARSDLPPGGQEELGGVSHSERLRTDGVHCRDSVVSKHNHCCTTAVHTVDPFSPPDLYLYKCKEFSVHGTMSYVVFQNLPVVIADVP